MRHQADRKELPVAWQRMCGEGYSPAMITALKRLCHCST